MLHVFEINHRIVDFPGVPLYNGIKTGDLFWYLQDLPADCDMSFLFRIESTSKNNPDVVEGCTKVKS